MTGMAEHADPHADQHADVVPHRHERPEDWGWHAEMGRSARIAGIICAVLLCSLVLASHTSGWELAWAVGIAASLVTVLVWDRNRRRNAWRS